MEFNDELKKNFIEFAAMMEAVQTEEKKLKEMKKMLKDQTKLVDPFLKELEEAGEKSIQVGNYVLKMAKVSFERKSYPYAKAYALALTKVNEATQGVLKEAKEATMTISQVAAVWNSTKVDQSELQQEDTSDMAGFEGVERNEVPDPYANPVADAVQSKFQMSMQKQADVHLKTTLKAAKIKLDKAVNKLNKTTEAFAKLDKKLK